MKKIVKLSTPWGHSFLKNQVHPLIDDFLFEIDNDVNECDYWVIWGDLPKNHEKITVICPKENVFYLTDEAHAFKKFNHNFLKQFKTIISVRDDLEHNNIIPSHEINMWHLDKSVNELISNQKIKKSKQLSVVCSDLTDLPGHKKRFAFVNKLIGHFKDRLDVYGRGFNTIKDKWDALAPYKYSIAIENSSINGYFTEKLSECFLAHTYPIYYGPPDIKDYFDSNCLLIIDIDDYLNSIKIIEELLECDPWDKLEESIIVQKNIYLTKYHLFSKLADILKNVPCAKKQKITIKSHRSYQHLSITRKIIKTLSNPHYKLQTSKWF